MFFCAFVSSPAPWVLFVVSVFWFEVWKLWGRRRLKCLTSPNPSLSSCYALVCFFGWFRLRWLLRATPHLTFSRFSLVFLLFFCFMSFGLSFVWEGGGFGEVFGDVAFISFKQAYLGCWFFFKMLFVKFVKVVVAVVDSVLAEIMFHFLSVAVDIVVNVVDVGVGVVVAAAAAVVVVVAVSYGCCCCCCCCCSFTLCWLFLFVGGGSCGCSD